MTSDNYHHWTSEDSFKKIAKSKRIFGLTEGRVYLSKDTKRSLSILGEKKDFKIVFDKPVEPDFAKKHPWKLPPSWWALIKQRQWVTPIGKNITWTHATVENGGNTLKFHDAVLEDQNNLHLIYGYARHFGRWLIIDLLPIWILVFFWFESRDIEQNLAFSGALLHKSCQGFLL